MTWKAPWIPLKPMPAVQRPPAPLTSRELLSIGELSERTGVPTSALRYYDDLGLVRPARRTAGQRRYEASAVKDVGLVLFFRDVGFTLNEIGDLLATSGRRSRQQLIDHKLAELAEQQHRIEVARAALEHGRKCPAGDPMKCSRFWWIIEGRLQGLSLDESHTRAH
jgi:DNA-binding transcriptional MerR regulator